MRPLLPIEQSEGKCQVAKCSGHSRRPLTGKSSANAAILVCFAMWPLKAGQRLLGGLRVWEIFKFELWFSCDGKGRYLCRRGRVGFLAALAASRPGQFAR